MTAVNYIDMQRYGTVIAFSMLVSLCTVKTTGSESFIIDPSVSNGGNDELT
ncbi:hypothetical protein OAK47_03620 [Planctomycetaceae bacterium]|nr:hypothetical protein [Planctomycetaceae bacterium]